MSENDQIAPEPEENDEPDVEAHRWDVERNDDRAERAEGPGRFDESRVERAE